MQSSSVISYRRFFCLFNNAVIQSAQLQCLTINQAACNSLFIFYARKITFGWYLLFSPLHSDGPENTNLRVSPPQQYFVEGSNIILSCSADSRPAALFHWFLNGSKLPDTGAELRLMNINMNQRGNYSCQAFNQKTLRYETSQPSAVSVQGMFE